METASGLGYFGLVERPPLLLLRGFPSKTGVLLRAVSLPSHPVGAAASCFSAPPAGVLQNAAIVTCKEKFENQFQFPAYFFESALHVWDIFNIKQLVIGHKGTLTG